MNLRRQALGGARYLMAREAIGILVRTAGILVVTALIGPEQYGLFAGPFFLVQFVAVIALFGSDIFLIRRHGDVEDAWFHQVFTFLLLTGAAVTTLGILAADLFANVVSDPRVILPLQVMLLSIPINILWVPARATLERRFDYQRLAVCEVGSDIAQYVVAVALALAGAGFWAPVCGFLARQTFMLLSSYILARYRPRLRWDREMLGELVAFGGGVSGSALAVRGRDLVISIVVGRYLGAAGVGTAALTQRLVETTAFVNRVMLRLIMVALGRIQHEAPRLRAAVEEASALQVLAVGPVLVLLCTVGAALLPSVLGDGWSDVVVLLPFVAFAALLSSLLSVPSTALIITGRRWTVFVAGVAGLAIYFGSAFLLVPELGLVGLGLAQILSTVAAWVRNLELRWSHGFSYRRALPWTVATTPLLFVPLFPWWGWLLAALPALVVLASRSARAELWGHVRTVLDRGPRPA